MSNDCLFCKIIAGDIPAQKVYEDDVVIAILDITPINPGHTLIIPKAHYRDITDTPTQTACHIMVTAQKLAPAIVAAAKAEGFNLGVNTGSVAGQSIFHAHLHIMPRTAEDGHKHWEGKAYQEGEAAEVAHSIKQALQ